jgi:hypothetical protein
MPGHPLRDRSIGVRLLTFHAKAAWSGSRRLHAGHRLANQRALARLILELIPRPSFGVNLGSFDTSTAIAFLTPT